MKRKILFITLFAVTLTFIGCSKKETPVMSNRVETETSTEVETTIENEEITEEVEAPTETIIEETVENNQETTTSTVDSAGSDAQIDEGDYVEPSVEDNAEAATTETASDSGYSAATQTALNNLKSAYDQGYMTEEEYNETVEIILRVEGRNNNPSSSSNSGGYGQIQLTPEQQAAADAMDTTGQGDQRTDIQYGQGDYTGLEHIRIN